MEQRGIYNGQSSMVVLESWGEIVQSVSSNHPSSRKREREEERNGQHLLESIRNRWQLDHSKKWLVGKYLEGSSYMPATCHVTRQGRRQVHDVVHTICLGIGIEDRSYRVDYSGTLWRRKYRCRYGTRTLEVVQK